MKVTIFYEYILIFGSKLLFYLYDHKECLALYDKEKVRKTR